MYENPPHTSAVSHACQVSYKRNLKASQQCTTHTNDKASLQLINKKVKKDGITFLTPVINNNTCIPSDAMNYFCKPPGSSPMGPLPRNLHLSFLSFPFTSKNCCNI